MNKIREWLYDGAEALGILCRAIVNGWRSGFGEG